ncbi:hypothetical protein D3C76_1760970 [compost metagenome]
MNEHVRKAESIAASHPFAVQIDFSSFDLDKGRNGDGQPDDIYKVECDAVHFSAC